MLPADHFDFDMATKRLEVYRKINGMSVLLIAALVSASLAIFIVAIHVAECRVVYSAPESRMCSSNISGCRSAHIQSSASGCSVYVSAIRSKSDRDNSRIIYA
jgi:hypothetical protein